MRNDASHTNSLRNLLLRHGFWASVGRGLNLFVGLASFACLTRLLGKNDFGIYATIYSYAGFAATLATFGLDGAIQIQIGKAMISTREKLPSILLPAAFFYACTSMLVSAAFILLFPWVGVWTTGQAAMVGVLPILPLLFFRGLLVIATATCRALDHPIVANTIGGAVNGGPFANGIFLCGLFLLYLCGRANWSSAIFMLGSSMGIATLCLLFSIAKAVQFNNIKLQQRRICIGCKSLLAISLPILGVSLLQSITGELDVGLVSYFLGAGEAGSYAAARRLTILMIIPLGLANLMVVSQVSRLYAAGELDRLEKTVRLACAVASVPAFILCCLFAIFPARSMVLFFGRDFADGAGILMAILPGQIIFILSGLCGLILVQCGHARLALISSFVAVIVMVALGPVALMHFGSLGFACVTSLTIGVGNLLNWFFAKYYLKIETSPNYRLLFHECRGILRKGI